MNVADLQADWPKQLLSHGLDLKNTFVEIRNYEPLRDKLRVWFLSAPTQPDVGLSNADVEKLIPPEVVVFLSSQHRVSKEESITAIRELLLRVFNLLSQSGELPAEDEIASVEKLIKEDKLPSLFPATEAPANLSKS